MTPAPETATGPQPEPEGRELGSRARTGLVWSLLNSAAARVLNVIAGLVIARVVSPEEFGTYAAALLVMTIVLSMNEVGLSVAVIRWKDGVDRITPTAVTGSLASSFVWFALMFAGAPLIAGFLNAPDATTAIQVLSFGVLLDGISTIPNALLMRAFKQRRRAVAEIVGFLVGTPIGIFLAAKHGASGLAIGLLIANIVATALILILAPSRPMPGWNRAVSGKLVRLGLPPALTSLLLLAIINIDSIVVSRVLGVAALGFYVLAFNIANWPWTLLSMSIRQVSLPAFSRLSEDRAGLEEAFARSLTLAGAVAVLSGILLATLAEPLVGILYGNKWLPAVVALQWLAVFGALRVILELSYDLLIASGRAGSLIRVQVGWITALVVALPVGAHLGGVAGVAIGQVIVAVLFVLPLNVRLLLGAGLRLGPLVRSLQPIGLAAASGTAVAVLSLQVDAPRGVLLVGAGLLITVVFSAAFVASRGGREALQWAEPPILMRFLPRGGGQQSGPGTRPGPAAPSASR